MGDEPAGKAVLYDNLDQYIRNNIPAIRRVFLDGSVTSPSTRTTLRHTNHHNLQLCYALWLIRRFLFTLP